MVVVTPRLWPCLRGSMAFGDRNVERTDHSTVDDVVRIFH